MKRFITPEQLLPAFFQNRQWDTAWAVQDLYRNWPRLAGARLARHSAPAALRGGRLWVYVANALWAQELAFCQGELLGRLRARLPGRELLGIRTAVEPSWFADPPENAATAWADPPPPPETLAAIGDEACREALARLWRATRRGRPGFLDTRPGPPADRKGTGTPAARAREAAGRDRKM